MKKDSYNKCPFCGGNSKKDLEYEVQQKKKREEKWKEYERLCKNLK